MTDERGVPEAAPLDRACGNGLLRSLDPADRALLERSGQMVRLKRREILFDVGQDVESTWFPSAGTVGSLVLILSDGRSVEAATIGCEGAIGGIISAGHKPAYTRAEVQIPGTALRVSTRRLDELKSASPGLRNLFSRYADFLLAQVMQSVACNTFHPLDARCCRWLLTTHDRVDGNAMPLTQEALAEMLGVQRTTVTAIARTLQQRGLISYNRGRVELLDRAGAEAAACECYFMLKRHFRAVLPELSNEGDDAVVELFR